MKVKSVLAGSLPLAFFIFASSALAANADVNVKASFISSPVSVSRLCTESDKKCNPLQSYAAFEVTITNSTTNAINQVVVYGHAEVTGDGAAKATYVDSIPSICTELSSSSGARTEIRCDVGQLKGSASFVVIFKSPTGGQSINFSGDGTFSEAASPTTPTVDGQFTFASDPIALTTTQQGDIQKSFKTVVPASGGTFVTGLGVPTDIDTFVTRLNVPSQSTATYSIAKADEKTPAEEACPTSAPCGGSVDISLKKKDGTKATFYPPNPANVLSQFLVIELWRFDFKGNVKNANIYYKDPDTTNPTYVPIFECAPYPVADSVARCIFDRKVFTNRDEEVKTGQVPAGSARIRILAGENGFYAW